MESSDDSHLLEDAARFAQRAWAPCSIAVQASTRPSRWDVYAHVRSERSIGHVELRDGQWSAWEPAPGLWNRIVGGVIERQPSEGELPLHDRLTPPILLRDCAVMAPAVPGLYVIHDSNGEVVYVGSTPLLCGALGLVERGHTSTELSRAIADEAGFALADKEAAARKVRRREFGFRVSWLVVMDRTHLDELTASLRKSMLPRYNA